MSAAMISLCSAAPTPSGMVGGGSLARRSGPSAKPGSRRESKQRVPRLVDGLALGCVGQHGGENAEDKREHMVSSSTASRGLRGEESAATGVSAADVVGRELGRGDRRPQ